MAGSNRLVSTPLLTEPIPHVGQTIPIYRRVKACGGPFNAVRPHLTRKYGSLPRHRGRNALEFAERTEA